MFRGTAALGLLFSVPIIIWALVQEHDDQSFRRTAAHGTGQVTSVTAGAQSYAEVHVVLAGAGVDGVATVVVVSTSGKRAPAVGTSVAVLVDPAHPRHAELLKGQAKPWMDTLAGGYGGLTVGVLGLLAAVRAQVLSRRRPTSGAGLAVLLSGQPPRPRR